MLAPSPPLPLTIVYIGMGYSDEITTEDEELDDVDRTEWREPFKSFSNVKAPRLNDGLVVDLSRCLRSNDGELPPEVFPELQELTYSGSGIGDIFSIIDPHQNAGHPIILTIVGTLLG